MNVAVVILNWNGAAMLEKYLPSVIASVESFNSSGAGETCASVVVADNGSDDGSPDLLSRLRPGLRVIRLERNFGFAEGYNKALAELDEELFVLLNSDVHTPDGWLKPLVDFMESHPRAGICQPRILSDIDRSSFEYAGASGGFLDRYGYPFCRGRILSKIEKDCGQYSSPSRVLWASGACMVVRSSVFRELGGFDASFFAHMEEIDLCWRAALLGHEVWCAPQSFVFHLGGGTLPNDSPRKLYLNYRNNLLMLCKNLPDKSSGRILCVRMLLDAASSLIYLLSFRPALFKAVLKAHRDFRSMKKNLVPSPRREGLEFHGLCRCRIILRFFLSRGRLTFDKLPENSISLH